MFDTLTGTEASDAAGEAASSLSAPPSAEPAGLLSRIAEVCGILNATEAALVSLVAEALATEAWAEAGIRSPEHWVAWRCGTRVCAVPRGRDHGPPPH